MTQREDLLAIVHAAAVIGWSPSREAEATGPYTVLGELAHRLVAGMQVDQTAQFGGIFDAVERTLSSASPDSRDVIIVGFLEDLQNLSLNRNVALTAWSPFLGPHTREAWGRLEAYWSGELSPHQFNEFIGGISSEATETPP